MFDRELHRYILSGKDVTRRQSCHPVW